MQLRDLRQIRQFVTHDASILVASALVSSWITVIHFSVVSPSSVYVYYNISRIISNTGIERSINSSS